MDARKDSAVREMMELGDTPTIAEMERLLASGDPLDRAVFELWRGRSCVVSVNAARLSRECADALLIALGELPPPGRAGEDAA